MYITFDSIDNSGKSTQIDLLKQTDLYKDALYVREPGSTFIGEVLRPYIKHTAFKSRYTREYMLLAARAELMATKIAPAIANGDTIISDRSFLSGVGYDINNSIEKSLNANLDIVAEWLPDRLILMILEEDDYIARTTDTDAIESLDWDKMSMIQSRISETADMLNIDTLMLGAAMSIKDIHEAILEFIAD